MDELKGEGMFFLYVSIIMLLIDFGPLYASFIDRLGYYFIPFQCVSLANLANCYDGKKKKGYMLMIVCVFLLIWVVKFVILGYTETVPYQLFWNT